MRCADASAGHEELAGLLSGLGASVSLVASLPVDVYRSYDDSMKMKPHVVGSVECPSIMVSFRGWRFLTVPVGVYAEGRLSCEWFLSATSPPELSKTMFRTRDGSWVFMLSRSDGTWPTSDAESLMRTVTERSSVP